MADSLVQNWGLYGWAICLAGFLLAFAATETMGRKRLAVKNLLTKYLLATAIGLSFFWISGYGLAYGLSFEGLFGVASFMPGLFGYLPSFEFFAIKAAVACTAIYVIYLAQSKRMTLRGYILVGAFFAAFIYPITTHWIWGAYDARSGAGWLRASGFIDHAGAVAVHMVAGWAALAVSLAIGPRNAFTVGNPCRYNRPHTVLWAVASVLLFAASWQLYLNANFFGMAVATSKAHINLFMAGSGAFMVANIFCLIQSRFFNFWYTTRAVLSGMIAASIAIDTLTLEAAAILGGIAALVSMALARFFQRYRIEDPSSVIAIHLGGGLTGGLLVAFFSPLSAFGPGVGMAGQFLIQLEGVLAVSLFVFGSLYAFVKIALVLVPMRIRDRDLMRRATQQFEATKPASTVATATTSGKVTILEELESTSSTLEDMRKPVSEQEKLEEGRMVETALKKIAVTLSNENEGAAPRLLTDDEDLFADASMETVAHLDTTNEEDDLQPDLFAQKALDEEQAEPVLIEEAALEEPKADKPKSGGLSPTDLLEIKIQNESMSRTIKRQTSDLEQTRREVRSLNDQLNDLTSAFVISERVKHSFLKLTQNIFNAHIQDMQSLTNQANSPRLAEKLPQLIHEKSIEHARNLASIKAMSEAMEISLARDQADVDLRKLVETIKAKYEDRVFAKELIFNVRYDRRIMAVRANSSNLRMLLEQLVERAIHDNTQGGLVHFDVRLEEDGSTTIEIVDSGRGYAPEELAEAIDPLNMQDDPTREVASSLGYALVKRLVEVHEGIMKVTSQAGVGTKVLISWPAEKTRLAGNNKTAEASF